MRYLATLAYLSCGFCAAQSAVASPQIEVYELQQQAHNDLTKKIGWLLNDPNVAWIGETQSDLRFTDPTPETAQLSFDWNQLSIEKRSIKPKATGFSSGSSTHTVYWEAMVMDWLAEEEGFANPQLTVKVTPQERSAYLTTVDTVVVYDRLGYEQLTIFSNEINPEDVVGIRVHQLVYWNSKLHSFGYQPLSFAPLWGQYNEEGKMTNAKPIMWFPVSEASNPQKIWAAEEVTYVAETRHLVAIQGENAVPSIKGEFHAEAFFTALRDDEQVKLYGSQPELELTEADRNRLFRPFVDTIVVFDPDTYQEAIKTVDVEVDWDAFKEARFVIRWFWDEQKHQLSYAFLGWGLLEQYSSHGSNVLHDRLLFYRMSEE